MNYLKKLFLEYLQIMRLSTLEWLPLEWRRKKKICKFLHIEFPGFRKERSAGLSSAIMSHAVGSSAVGAARNSPPSRRSSPPVFFCSSARRCTKHTVAIRRVRTRDRIRAYVCSACAALGPMHLHAPGQPAELFSIRVYRHISELLTEQNVPRVLSLSALVFSFLFSPLGSMLIPLLD